jgi:hypothetical protein
MPSKGFEDPSNPEAADLRLKTARPPRSATFFVYDSDELPDSKG